MLQSILLAVAARLTIPLLLIFSTFLLLRGHNEPGGGFIGGLVLGLALILGVLAFGKEVATRYAPISPTTSLGVGLAISLGSGLYCLPHGLPIFTGVWGGSFPMIAVGDVKVGTIFFFDVGVFFVVYGTVASIALALLEDDRSGMSATKPDRGGRS